MDGPYKYCVFRPEAVEPSHGLRPLPDTGSALDEDLVHTGSSVSAIPLRIALSQLFGILYLWMTTNVTAAQTVPAFLPMKEAVPRSQPADIDGVWRISTIGKRIRIEAGRA